MGKILEIRAYILKFYAKYSRYVDGTFRFVLAWLAFTFISDHIGYVEAISNATMILGLSLICAFLPISMTAVLSAVLVIVQFSTLSLGVTIVAALITLIMFVFYFRFSPGKGHILLLTPVAFSFNLPVLIPIVFGMIGGPVCAIPIAFGAVVYYMITYVKNYAAYIESLADAGAMGQIASFSQQLFSEREMWMNIIALTACLLIVYSIRRLSVDYAWEIAAVTGALVNLLMMTVGYIKMDVSLDVELIPSSIIAVGVAIILKVFVFSVNYTRSEHLQFEDDEYYYYVKAVPKVSMTVRERNVKKINVRQTTGTMEVEKVQRKIDQIEIEDVLDDESEIQRIIEEELKK